MKTIPLTGQGSETEILTDGDVRTLLEDAFENATVDNLVIIPDGTRTARPSRCFSGCSTRCWGSASHVSTT